MVQPRGRSADAAAAAAGAGRQADHAGHAGAGVPDEHHRAGSEHASGGFDIPEEVLDILYRWRPTPLQRAVRLEKYLKTPARIYYKDESVSPPGSHKPNTAVAQAWYNKQFGIKRLTTETGAGQWGSALAFACKLFGLECKVYMVRISFDQKPFRKLMMQVWGAKCVASPSTETNAGREYPRDRCPTRRAAWASPSARPSRRR